MVADLVINKPFLKVSPSYIEFKRAHLYQINPVGFGAIADLSAMDRVAKALRGDAPTLFASVLHGDGMDAMVSWVREAVKHRRRPLQR